MPTYNGIIAYPIEVLLHLAWCYVVFAVLLCIVLPAPLVTLWALNGNGAEVALGFFMLFSSAPGLTLGWVHLAVFAVLRVYFLPRFPFAPSWVTVAIAVAFGSIALALATYVLPPFDVTLEPGAAALVRAFERTTFIERAGLFAVFTGLAATASAILLTFAGPGAYTYGLAKWIGWLVVGREAFDAFVERETAKLSREYDEYVKSIRKG
jgi:hypothetical protein